MPTHEILAAADVRAFFRDEMSTVLKHQRLTLTPDTEFYLVNLLGDFVRTEHLYELQSNGRHDEVPLAFLLQRALEAEGRMRVSSLKKLGDTSLVVSGFFSDRLARRLVDVDYYIAMGERAYDGAADLAGAHRATAALREIFAELARTFARVVDCLMEVSERARTTAPDDLVRLYERWRATGSERLARRLAAAGILPAGAGESGLA
ncbi:MAG: hypothetical protein P1V51_16695 [Deltaproteobacteria bacterium]|nr:hypothetical protein [Deltaproteobacteria bacterium]